jgi:hypothetical protein
VTTQFSQVLLLKAETAILEVNPRGEVVDDPRRGDRGGRG